MLSATQGQVPLTAEEKKMFERKLDRVVRWNTLLVHVNINTPDMIKYVFGDRIDVDSLEYDWARNKIMENHRTYKSKTCSQFKLLVNRQVAQDHTLLELSAASFAAKFEKMFNECRNGVFARAFGRTDLAPARRPLRLLAVLHS